MYEVRFEKLENELVRMEKRMSDQFNQFRVFVEKTLSSQSNQPVAKCAGSHDDLSILPEEVRLRDEEISAELRSRREKNA